MTSSIYFALNPANGSVRFFQNEYLARYEYYIYHIYRELHT